MRRFVLMLILLSVSIGGRADGGSSASPSPPIHGERTDASRGSMASSSIDMRRAVAIALEMVKDKPRFKDECDIGVRRNGNEWIVHLSPVPPGPGLDLLVTVRADGSTRAAPLY